MDADNFEVHNSDGEEELLNTEEIAQVRSVLSSLGTLERTINDLQKYQVLMLGSVSLFANRTERRQNNNLNEIRANQELLQQVIEQLQQFAGQNETREHTQESVIAQLLLEVTTLRNKVLARRTTSAEPPLNPIFLSEEDKKGLEWDVLGPMPSHASIFSGSVLERRVDKCHKQRETPMYGGEENEDIEVYVLNMIKWYAAYGLYFQQEQVDLRVGELMMNHTKGKAKAWLLQEWSTIVRKMKKRFVTKSLQEDLEAQFFACTQGNRQLDTYNDEFRRLAQTAGVSEYIKILRYKQGLSSMQLLHLLKTKSFETLDELIEAAPALNPREAARPTRPTKKLVAKVGKWLRQIRRRNQRRYGAQHRVARKTVTQKINAGCCTPSKIRNG